MAAGRDRGPVLSAADKSFRDDARFRILRLLDDHPEMTQREISDALGISLGIVNYCLKGLVEKGNLKVRNFRTSRNKLAYAYVLTPGGIAAKAQLTRAYLARRLAEFDALKSEIEALSGDLGDADGFEPEAAPPR